MNVKQQAKDILVEARDAAKASNDARTLVRIAELLLYADGVLPYDNYKDNKLRDDT